MKGIIVRKDVLEKILAETNRIAKLEGISAEMENAAKVEFFGRYYQWCVVCLDSDEGTLELSFRDNGECENVQTWRYSPMG